MRVALVSNDSKLCKACREILTELDHGDWTIVAAKPNRETPEADLYIWDFTPNFKIPANIPWAEPAECRRHFFLVHRKNLPQFQAVSPLSEARILLKPLTQAALRAYLEQIGPRAKAEPGGGALLHERDEVLQCLIQANLRLQEYDQDRTNFLARAVHDFRAPLTALNGYCGLLLGEHLGPVSQDQREVLKRMERSAQRLSRMASAMFQLSVGRHLESKPDLEELNIEDAIEQALHETAPFSDEKRITISVDLKPQPEALYFQRTQLEQVLINLLDNACKFTPKFGSIEISGYPFFWERRAGQVINFHWDRRIRDLQAPNSFKIDIRDSGPGIPAKDLASIFEEYTSYAGRQDRSGGGLGLAISRAIMDRHSGRLWAESTSKGAVFSLVIPFRRAESHPASGHAAEIGQSLGQG
jgi:signal transduction histidine kinase